MNKFAKLDTHKTPETKRSSDHKKTRPPYERMVTIHNLLVSNRYPNCSSVSKKFEVTPKTIHRDIEFMRYNWNLPIEYDTGLRGFYYTEEVPFLPISNFNIKELSSIKYILQQLPEGIPSEIVKNLESIASKMISLNHLPDHSEAA